MWRLMRARHWGWESRGKWLHVVAFWMLDGLLVPFGSQAVAFSWCRLVTKKHFKNFVGSKLVNRITLKSLQKRGLVF